MGCGNEFQFNHPSCLTKGERASHDLDMDEPKITLSYEAAKPKVLAGRRTVETFWALMKCMTWIHWILMGIFQAFMTLIFLFLFSRADIDTSVTIVIGWVAIILGIAGLMRAKKALAPGVFLLDLYLVTCWLVFGQQILRYLDDPGDLFWKIRNDLNSVTSWFFAILILFQIGASIHALILTILLKLHPEWDPQEAEREALRASCQ